MQCKKIPSVENVKVVAPYQEKVISNGIVPNVILKYIIGLKCIGIKQN